MAILPLLLTKADHAAIDLCVPYKPPPPSCMGKIQWYLTKLLTIPFSWYCSFIQCFQLQASKVSDDCNIADMHFCQQENTEFVLGRRTVTNVDEILCLCFSQNTKILLANNHSNNNFKCVTLKTEVSRFSCWRTCLSIFFSSS